MSDIIKLVGKNIKEIRKVKGFTQEELAEKCGLQTSFLAGVERGERNITLQTFEKIVNGLEESPEFLFYFGEISYKEIEFSKKEKLLILRSIVEKKDEKDINLIIEIARTIFKTYGKK